MMKRTAVVQPVPLVLFQIAGSNRPSRDSQINPPLLMFAWGDFSKATFNRNTDFATLAFGNAG
jgi:hypothetical protein